MNLRRLLLPLAATLAVGCASRPAPVEQVAMATASVESARTAGAAQSAPADLSAAIDKLERARAESRAGRQVEARQLAEAADADAQVARARANAVRAERALAELRRDVQSLQGPDNRTPR